MNLKNIISSLLPHGIAIIIFIIISSLFFSMTYKGYQLKQHDIKTFKGMSKEIYDYREKTCDEAL